MTRVYRITTSQVEGVNANNNDSGRVPSTGELGLYDDNGKLALVIGNGARTHQKSKVLSPGVFYGSNADSGDGYGLDTIKLIPDAGLGTDQYIVVDPTVPNHIHLRAGGTQDSSSADLFLGGELNHVKVSDLDNSVTISTDAGGEGATRNWLFDGNGGLTFPDSTVQSTAWTGAAVIVSDDEPQNPPVGQMWFVPSTGALSLYTGSIWFQILTGSEE